MTHQDPSITLMLTEDEARALVAGWGFAIGPVMANEAESAEDKTLSHVTKPIIIKAWEQQVTKHCGAVGSLTDKLTELIEQLIAVELGKK